MKLFTNTAPETEDIGIADNDIDAFLKSLLESVTRECAQNSNDECVQRPARMTFNLTTIPISEIPDVDKFKDVILRCLHEANSSRARKAQEFFENANQLLQESEISTLTISDSGTRGAGGIFEKGNKFFTLVVSKGQTDKQNLYSAGSFGIGKNASFAGSALRLVFYSSCFEQAGGLKFYCMGKSVLTSWRNHENANMGHKVFFGADDEHLAPIESAESLPKWLQKSEPGLKLNIISPRIELRDGWTDGYVSSLLSNFFLAIYDGHLEFTLSNDEIVLNKSTMLGYFDDPAILSAAEDAGQLEKFEWARACSAGLASGEFHSEIVEIQNLGKFEIMIKVDEGLPKKVCFIRNGMFITTSLANFSRPLKRFPSTKDFIAIVRPKSIDDPSSEMIKRMENPEHNELTTGYIADEQESKQLTAAMQYLEVKIREVINKFAKMEILEVRQIEEMKEFFQIAGSETSNDSGPEEYDPTRVAINTRLQAQRNTSQTPGGKSGGKGKRGKTQLPKKKGRGPGSGSNGKYSEIRLACRALKRTPKAWRLEIDDISESGTVSMFPQEKSRSQETRLVKISSCSQSQAQISPDKLSVSFPVDAGASILIDLEVDKDVNVIDFRPVLTTTRN